MALFLAIVWFSLSLEFIIAAESGKVLVIPQDADVWMDMMPLVDKLKQKGHEIVLVIPKTPLNLVSSKGFTVKLYSAPLLESGLSLDLGPVKGESTINRFLSAFSPVYRRMKYTASFLGNTCLHLLEDKMLLRYLENTSFDAAIMDPWFPCGPILAENLSLRSIYVLPGIPCGWESKVSGCPKIQPEDGWNQIGFVQRIKSVLIQLLEHIVCQQISTYYERLASHYLHKEVKLLQVFSQAEIWLFRHDYVLRSAEPRGTNMVFVGGDNCVEKTPISQEFEQLVNSSGEHGFVVFSLGSMVSEIPIDRATDIAKALGSIPQKVIWRYTGKVPSNLAENTHLVKWLPQNDLLAHPKARAFITHAGSHGIYEAICNAVPVVMLPLFGDQMDNAVRIESRGAGVTLNVLDMTSEDLSNALKNVIENPSYKKNIERLSALHLDRPIHPLDLAVYWVEFVMRHKGAPHLRPAAHDLNFFQYHSLDVIGFLLLVIITTLFISLKCSCMVFRRCCGRRSSPKSKSKSKSKPE